MPSSTTRLTIKLPARQAPVAPLPPPKPVKVTVPAPNVHQPLDMTLNVGIARSDPSRTVKTAKLDDFRLRNFFEHADRVVLDKTLDDFTRESADRQKRSHFEAVCTELGPKHAAIAVSTVYVDPHNVPIFAYFASRLREREARHDLTLATQYDGRTSVDVSHWGDEVEFTGDQLGVSDANKRVDNAQGRRRSSKPGRGKEPKTPSRIAHDGILVSFIPVLMSSALSLIRSSHSPSFASNITLRCNSFATLQSLTRRK